MSRNKIVSLQDLEKIVRRAQKTKKTVVWTNGCFDLLHVGHVRYLEKAKALGDILVVGLNSNASTRKLKGAGRPLNRQAHRAEVLAALESVDYITIFGATSPARLLERLKPNIFVKGADYSVKTMNQKERAAVEQGGGTFAFIKFVAGSSTTNLIEKIRETSKV
jgi:rfaE bifunctional protein nucleotidyltransferase chain/domain